MSVWGDIGRRIKHSVFTPAAPPPAVQVLPTLVPAPVPPRKTKRRRDRPRRTDRLRWDDQPESTRILQKFYASHEPEVVAVMLSPLFPGHFITVNMVIGRANRLKLSRPRKRAE